MIDGRKKLVYLRNMNGPSSSLMYATKDEARKEKEQCIFKMVFQSSIKKNRVAANRLQNQYPTININLAINEAVSPKARNVPASANVPQATVAIPQVFINRFKSKSNDLCIRKTAFEHSLADEDRTGASSSFKRFPGHYNIY
jgi:hypothetical protein